ncbi:hypothetical protein ACQEU3_17085 [Spirillospora sp. CA-253888]
MSRDHGKPRPDRAMRAGESAPDPPGDGRATEPPPEALSPRDGAAARNGTPPAPRSPAPESDVNRPAPPAADRAARSPERDRGARPRSRADGPGRAPQGRGRTLEPGSAEAAAAGEVTEEEMRERLRRRAVFLRELAEARELRRRVTPHRSRRARIHAALRRRTFRSI